MKHENEPEDAADGMCMCNFCDELYDPYDRHTCKGNDIPPRLSRKVVEEEGKPQEFGPFTWSKTGGAGDPPTLADLVQLNEEVSKIPQDPAWRTSIPPEYPERVHGYESLEIVLYEAYQQAATGKGAARHGRGAAFDAQPTQTISALLGTDGGLAFQAMKKINEGMRLDPAAKKKELLGAINYIASIIIFMNKETK